MGYAGHKWIESSLGCKCSSLGRKVADVLGFAYKGIYHVDNSALDKAEWDSNHYVRVVIQDGISTYDFNTLTELVFLCHVYRVRLQINSCNPGRLALMFHERTETEKRMSRYHPDINEAVATFREMLAAAGATE